MGKPIERVWKMWQDTYSRIAGDQIRIRKLERFEYSSERINNALSFLGNEPDIGIYPAQSRIVAIIYATMIEQVYGEEFYETLNDPDLLFGQDAFFVPYLDDMETYDAILDRLKEIPNWLDMGNVPRIVENFYLECTPKGTERIRGNSMTNSEAL